MADRDALLSVTGLSLSVGKKRLCRDLEFSVREGECWGLLGPNGCGKTTLLHQLAGLGPAESGEICLHGRPLDSYDDRDRGRQIGVMFQNEDYVFPATVLERVLAGRYGRLALWKWETAEDIAAAKNALARVNMEGFEDRLLSTLSGGERRRVQIAALLCQAPALALLDEPENDLDLKFQSELIPRIIARFTEAGCATVVVLHDINLAARYCSHLVLLNGEDTLCGPIEETGTAARFSMLYGCRIREVRDGTDRHLVAG